MNHEIQIIKVIKEHIELQIRQEVQIGCTFLRITIKCKQIKSVRQLFF